MQPVYRTVEIITEFTVLVLHGEYHSLEFIIIYGNGRLHLFQNSSIVRQLFSRHACQRVQIRGADADSVPLQSFVHDGNLHLAHLVRFGGRGVFGNESQGIAVSGNRILGIQSARVCRIERKLIRSRLFVYDIAQPFRIGEAYLHAVFRLCLDNGIDG